MIDQSLFHGPNAGYMLELYERYCEDPQSVDPATRAYFENGEQEGRLPPARNDRATSSLVIQHADTPAIQPTDTPAIKPTDTPTDLPTDEPSDSLIEQNVNGRAEFPDHGRAEFLDHTLNNQPMRDEPPSEHHQATSYTPTEGRQDSDEASTFSLPPADDTTCYRLATVVGSVRLVRLIRELGHLAADIDPLGKQSPGDPGLELATHNLTEEDLEMLPPSVVISPLAYNAQNAHEAIDRLRHAYSGTIGYEDDHVQNHEERAWLRDAAESKRFCAIDTFAQRDLLERLTEVETFERFIHQTFPGQKRFSLEGNDVVIPILDSIIHDAAEAGTREVLIGMAHRGRLNVLAHILGKPYSAILAEFQGPNYYNKATYLGWTGDVKYHLGARRAYRDSAVYEMPISLVPNPSHLEFVNPVVQGHARAAQRNWDKPGEAGYDPKAALPILMHGDASFPGQGVVAETLNLSRLRGYHTGGTIHIIINNQIGFTTCAGDSRSTLYAGDLAKGFEIPIVHVNADDPVACIAAARMAWAYRDRFGKDFLIDLVGYRRWGHNEGDEPSFTQPIMYQKIADHPTVRELWARRLESKGVITADEAAALLKKWQDRMQRAQHEVEKGGRIEATVAVSVSTLLHRPVAEAPSVSVERLQELNEAMLQRPDGFTVNPKLERLLQRRRTAIHEKGGIEWGHAEALAFATIVSEGTPIRLTGQDVERGTFSHRHMVLSDGETGERFVPLHALPQAQASFCIYNSPLSEAAALGFEYGYSTEAPEVLVIWEAQFGDFCNGAQVFIDQFIVSGNAKWGQLSGLVLLLPHGYEGQGPEHSSARLERFLQLAADNNIRIVNCTSAAQYFHLLRRQASMLKSDPRPLIVMTPKSLLRHPLASSSLSELVDGHFQPVLPPDSSNTSPSNVTRLILCSGKVSVDLMSGAYTSSGAGSSAGPGTKITLPKEIAIARVEEFYPFPVAELEAVIATYPNLRELVWLQEEPENMGAWRYIERRLRALLQKGDRASSIAIIYCGRPEAASPAEGNLNQHKAEQTRILNEVLNTTLSQPVNGR